MRNLQPLCWDTGSARSQILAATRLKFAQFDRKVGYFSDFVASGAPGKANPLLVGIPSSMTPQ
jgi:hypothetical protein